jgi:hypothetical protein
MAAVDVELSDDDLQKIETAAAAIQIQGNRYPAHLQNRVGKLAQP